MKNTSFSSLLNQLSEEFSQYRRLNSATLPWNKIRLSSIDMMGDDILTEGKLVLAADDSTYGKSGKKIEGSATHFDHAAKLKLF